MATVTTKKRSRKLYGPPALVLRYLYSNCTGKDHAKTAADICGPCYINDSQLRKIINELRRRGYPVCSDSRTGYWVTGETSELDASIKHMTSRRTKINEALRGLRSAKRKAEKAAAAKAEATVALPVNTMSSPPLAP